MILRGSHQRRVKRAAHLEMDNARGAPLLADLSGTLDRFRIARDHGLIRCVDVRGDREARLVRGLFTCGFHFLRGKTKPRRHRAGPLFARLLHQLAAPPDELRRLRRAQRGRGDVRRILPQRVARSGDDTVHGVAHNGKDGGAMGKNRGLRVLRRRQLVFRSLEHDSGQWDVERFVDRVEYRARRRKPFREIFSHADFLRALSRAEPDRTYHRTTMLPQVKPAPNAHSITTMPGFSRPVFTASSSAMAMDAADVFPNRSTLT